jgi:hypothetical protein
MRVGPLVWICLALAGGAAIATSCSQGPRVEGYQAEPASTQERALARREREQRKKALDEQGDAAAPEPPPPEPPPPPPPEPTASASAVTAAVDAGPDAADAAVDAGPPPVPDAGGPDPRELCDRICERALECARRMLEGAGDSDPTFLERMLKEMADQCRQECSTRIPTASTAQLAAAEKCLSIRDCEDFMSCMRDLLDQAPR